VSTGVSAFDLNQPDLSHLLARVEAGAIQLPDFQRGWVWREEGIRSLLASITLSYPIGALLMLKTGGSPAFFPRAIEGAPDTRAVPELLLLDGQQRITSLYQSLRMGRPVRTTDEKGKDIERWFYLDIGKCMDPDIDRAEAVLTTPADRVVRRDFNRVVVLDLSSTENQYKEWAIPLEVAFDAQKTLEWQGGLLGFLQKELGPEGAMSRFMEFQQFQQAVLIPLRSYRIPSIELARGTDHSAVCQVFENVNTGGVKLTVFELLTAMFAAEDEGFRLRADWYGDQTSGQPKARGREHRLHAKPVLQTIRARDFMQAVTLLSSFEDMLEGRARTFGCHRKDMLKLKLAGFHRTADRIEEGFKKAARMLERLCIYEARNVPYATQLVPLAAILARLGPKEESQAVREKLEQWYWCGVFGELYGSSTETRFANDLSGVLAWIDGSEELPTTVRDSGFSPTRLKTLRTRNSAAYKGIAARLLAHGCRDLARGDRVAAMVQDGEPTDIHHLFPQRWCADNGISSSDYNAIYNRTPLARRTNQRLSGHAPSAYLVRLEGADVTTDQLDGHLRSHLSSPELMRSDNYAEFRVDRSRRLLDIIEQSTGKPISGRESDEVVRAFGGPLPRMPAAVDAPTQTFFGRYAVLEEFHGGGMSRAYRVLDKQTGAQVFLKMAPTGDTLNAKALQREQAIYEKLERAGAEGMLRVIDVHLDSERMALVTELADGGSLEAYVRNEGGSLRYSEAKSIGLIVLNALDNLHQLDIVHRDIKPGNIFRVGGEWKLGDFGLAKNLVRLQTQRTLGGNWTPGYAPEEQLIGVEADPSMDVYALGKTITYLLTGQTDPDQLQEPWRALLKACTEKDPEQRPTLAAVRERLDALPC